MNGFTRTLAVGMALAAGTMASVSVASATTWNFGGAFASLGPDEVFTVGPDSLMAAAFTYAEPGGVAAYTATTLMRRNQAPDDIGLGVCNSGDGAGCNTITS